MVFTETISQCKQYDHPFSRKTCQSFGGNWDLAIINFRVEYTYLGDLLRHNCLSDEKFWTGYRYQPELETVFGKPAYWRLKWQKKSKATGDCVTYKGGNFERSDCQTDRAVICENHNYNDVCQPTQKKEVDERKGVFLFKFIFQDF